MGTQTTANTDEEEISLCSSIQTKSPPVEQIISFGIPSIPNKTIIALKGNKEDNNTADASSSTYSTNGDDAFTSTRSNSVVSFNEDVTMNHVDNFRYVLNKRERYSIWYSDMEMSRMFVDGYKEKMMTDELSNTNTDDVLENGTKTTTTTTKTDSNTTKRRKFFLTKKAAKRISNFFSSERTGRRSHVDSSMRERTAVIARCA